jgi:hypothetical protein
LGHLRWNIKRTMLGSWRSAQPSEPAAPPSAADLCQVRAREARRLFCPLQSGRAKPCRTFFRARYGNESTHAGFRHGRCRLCRPPLSSATATAWPALICVTSADLRTLGGSFRAQWVYGAARRGGFVCARMCNGVRWPGVRRSADRCARATLRCLPSGGGNTVTEAGWGKRRGIWKAR